MRCLILGATGQVGSNLVAACTDRGLAHLGTYYRFPNPEYAPLDIRDADSLNELIADYQPDAVFHAIGLPNGGFAEAYPEVCRQVTVEGTRLVTDAIYRHGGKLVYFSSDEVFGECATARREEDVVAPLGN